jgi:hypothetical protein
MFAADPLKLKKLGNDASMHFWKAFGMLMEGSDFRR